MIKSYTTIVKQEGDWWIERIKEIFGINYKERMRKELMKSLKITLKVDLTDRQISD